MTRLNDPAAGPVVDTARVIEDPHAVFTGLRDRPPARIRFADGSEGWLITRYDDVKLVSGDPRVSRDLDGLQRLAAAGAGEAGAGAAAAGDDPLGPYGWLYRHLLNRDPPDHTRLRRLVSKAFTPTAIDRFRPRIEQVAGELLDAMSGEQTVDLLPSFAVPLPVTAISELLGVPEQDRPDFWAWSHVLNGDTADNPDLPGTLREVTDYLGALADRKQAEPGPDLLSHMVRESQDGDRLSRAELIAMALLMLLAGHDTTVNLIANGVLAFLRSPGQLARLRADPALLPGAVEEILRYDGPVNISVARFTLEPVEVGGVLIPAGEVLYPSILAANRDPRRFADPDRFDIGRDSPGHLGLGHGIHFCLGAPLARMEGRIALGLLLSRFPALRLAADPDTIAYRNSTLMHGPVSLPVHLR
jgi:cytochrome P450